jgi:hypothetical protein
MTRAATLSLHASPGRSRAGWLARLALLPLLFLLGPGLARATLLVTAQAGALVDRADAIVLGSVRATRARWEGARIVTDVDLEVAETIKGQPARILTVVAPGGKIGDVRMQVVGGAEFRSGDRSILFLSLRDGTPRLLGLSAGKIDVRRYGAEELVMWPGAGSPQPLSHVLELLRLLSRGGSR